ncbi:MAG: M1 family metallopeptidase, partial [Patescibacteria group bacterium]|nr:M1 family metallopeptidase [Patescibacteria group bacterium]
MQNQHRLPGHVVPERYRLMLKPDLEGFAFQGEETIYLKLKKSDKQIILHAKELEILSAQFASGKRQFTAKSIVYNEEGETVVLQFRRVLPKGKAELSIKFKGVLNDKMRGFYRSRYLHDGREKYLATTQFEATDARRAFPCFDEPASKAVFDVTLIVPKQMTAVSNTVPSKIAEHDASYKVVEFAPTPKMSTYLLAFVVGDLEYIEARSKRGVLVRVFTTPEKKHQAKFALSCATRALDFYENELGLE